MSKYHNYAVGNWPWKQADPQSFTDVPFDYIFYTQIETAKYYSFVSGYGDKTYKPENAWDSGLCGIDKPCATPPGPMSRGAYIQALYDYGIAHSQLPLCVVLAPTMTLTARPLRVATGEKTIVTWTSKNTDYCTATAGSTGWPGTQLTNGSWPSGPLTNTVTYKLTCTGEGGSVTRSVIVTVIPLGPSVTIDADPGTVPTGSTSVLTWSSTGASSCTASSGPWAGSKELSGVETTVALEQTTTFEITCTDSLGNASKAQTTVYVMTDGGGAPVVDLQANAGGGYKDTISGQPPILDVDLKAVTSGTATGPITYKFYCDASDALPTIIETINTTDNPHTQIHTDLCNYVIDRKYTAKVEVTRGGAGDADIVEIIAAKACQLVQARSQAKFAYKPVTFTDISRSLNSIIVAFSPASISSKH